MCAYIHVHIRILSVIACDFDNVSPEFLAFRCYFCQSQSQAKRDASSAAKTDGRRKGEPRSRYSRVLWNPLATTKGKLKQERAKTISASVRVLQNLDLGPSLGDSGPFSFSCDSCVLLRAPTMSLDVTGSKKTRNHRRNAEDG